MFRPLFSMYACDYNWLWRVSYVLDASKMGRMSLRLTNTLSTFIGRCGGRLKDIHAGAFNVLARRYARIQNKPAPINLRQ